MSAARAAFSLARRVPLRQVCVAPRSFATVAARHKDLRQAFRPEILRNESRKELKLTLDVRTEIKTEKDLLPPGAEPGTIPTDLEQATGLERLEILGKMQGIDIFDMSPLPSDRRGTFEDPIVVKSAGDEFQAGCTGSPADSHIVKWLVMTRKRPFERCPECGSCYRMDYVGPPDDPHHHHHGYEEPKTMADYVKPEYWYR
ncbi:Cytochrome c oxidase subunit 4 [Exophiala xenobiotica]|uniref:Cytochrome c oxidase subunit 4, mitochondrial n=1 Tax=Vermiconidia calcicola TaxID=1690605 RepID=A0AAV9PUW1_9PEZI|nr:Cytochrome c oxidase subunit 4 [Exophiala xenobiotica]KAK5529541.1 Cytochrome c oxidase subunit 4 [Vermiconidia calcicola]KAK5529630.1 Cytochrome c oxidase subunit 4 [Chaetothyriales sp. CCFEE 6169]KAK5210150.1 Cytochrome c oxidase subunit 4 [Exophiala xenobiotica]KAK5228635.1 Cytochrome c oxidase subunit 4 [Exophiala xenobiotica]